MARLPTRLVLQTLRVLSYLVPSYLELLTGETVSDWYDRGRQSEGTSPRSWTEDGYPVYPARVHTVHRQSVMPHVAELLHAATA